MRLLTPKALEDQIDYFENHPDSTVRTRGLFLCREIELYRALLREHGIACETPREWIPDGQLTLAQARSKHILQALERSDGNIREACQTLHLASSAFYTWYHSDPANKQATDAIAARFRADNGKRKHRRSNE